MLRRIISWIKRFDKWVDERARLTRGVAVRCDKCKEVVSGWFGSGPRSNRTHLCMKCMEEEFGPNDPLLKGVKDHIHELVTGEKVDEGYLFVARSDDPER